MNGVAKHLLREHMAFELGAIFVACSIGVRRAEYKNLRRGSMKAKRRYVAQDFFHARTLPGLACQEGENGKMALKCAIVRMKTAEVRIFLVVLLNWQKVPLTDLGFC